MNKKFNSIPPELLEKYKKNIPKKLEQIQSLIKKLKQQKDVSVLNELHLQIHKLAGNAKLYGYSSVSHLCKKMDAELTERKKTFEKEFPDNFLVVLEDFYQKLEKEFL